jgi:predicted N-formylglutamate amidohydrolase
MRFPQNIRVQLMLLLPQLLAHDNWPKRIIAGRPPIMPFELQDEAWTPVRVLGRERTSRWLILCDHASNQVPPEIGGGTLGVSAEDMDRHIAYDVGAAGVAVRLAEQLNAPVVLSNFSRLVIDPNRGEDDPTLVMRLYDGTIIPANRHADDAEVERRLRLCYRPYHATVAELAMTQTDTVIVSVHSFTPQLRGRPKRPWHLGFLHAEDTRLSDAIANMLRADGHWTVGMNVPYSGKLAGDTIDKHAIQHARQNTLIEIRNDLIAEEAGQLEWADRLAHILPKALDAAEI